MTARYRRVLNAEAMICQHLAVEGRGFLPRKDGVLTRQSLIRISEGCRSELNVVARFVPKRSRARTMPWRLGRGVSHERGGAVCTGLPWFSCQKVKMISKCHENARGVLCKMAHRVPTRAALLALPLRTTLFLPSSPCRHARTSFLLPD